MKNLKKIFAVIAIIIAIPLVVALFVKKRLCGRTGNYY